MRFILQDDVLDQLPANWDTLVANGKAYVDGKVEEAREAAANQGKTQTEVEIIALKARHEAINKRAAVWGAAADALQRASNGKCWYCESSQDRSDKPVDHFRPKNSVAEDPDHPGYWWLAFDWKNYRYSCTYCNSKRNGSNGGTSGGKHDHFPIIAPPPYAHSENDPQDRAKLLDPTDDADTKLLTFLPNGFPHPANDEVTTVERVNISISLYHLNHGAIVKRRKRLADDLSQHVQNANVAIERGDDQNYRFHKKEIIKRVRATSDYTSAARIYLQTHRTHQWVEEILSRDL
jgi:uncharacterized protein (TIGR02646 family)